MRIDARNWAAATMLAAVVSTAGCGAPAMQAQLATPNPSVSVDLLFTYDGCRVYRFYDNGQHYFVRCDPATASAASTAATLSRVSCGKNCTRDDTIQTIGSSPSVAPPAKPPSTGGP